MQGFYWLLTIPNYEFIPYLPNGVQYIRGQLERGADTGYLHWQIIVAFTKKCRLRHVKLVFGEHVHAELSRSSAADQYVWKDETAVEGTRFELGERKLKRNSCKDWETIRRDAQRGQLDAIPADIYVRHYGSLKRIVADHLQPLAIERRVVCYWALLGQGNLEEPGRRRS